MTARLEDIEARWIELTALTRPAAAVPESVFAEVVAGYRSKARHYHNVSHLADLLALSAAHAPHLADRVTVDLAIFFHDAVYSATRSDNEEQSARLARKCLEQLGFAEHTLHTVEDYVLATKHGSSPPLPSDTDVAYLLDFDLSILGAEREAYAAYAAAIRRE